MAAKPRHVLKELVALKTVGANVGCPKLVSHLIHPSPRNIVPYAFDPLMLRGRRRIPELAHDISLGGSLSAVRRRAASRIPFAMWHCPGNAAFQLRDEQPKRGIARHPAFDALAGINNRAVVAPEVRPY
jgi:hypothetical protein